MEMRGAIDMHTLLLVVQDCFNIFHHLVGLKCCLAKEIGQTNVERIVAKLWFVANGIVASIVMEMRGAIDTKHIDTSTTRLS
jgi:hypothetical protein